MDDVLNRLEKVVDQLTGGKSYVYVLEEHETYDGISKIIGCYSSPQKAYDEACNIIEYVSFSLSDIEELGNGHCVESYDINSMQVIIHKFIIQ